jgi:hypothetical protein
MKMLNRRIVWFLLISLLGVALAVYFEPTRCVRGWVWGEAFFDGRPSSYWRGVIIHDLDPPPPHWLDRVREWIAPARDQYSSGQLALDLEADNVLRELLGDQDARVVRFACRFLEVHEHGTVPPPGWYPSSGSAIHEKHYWIGVHDQFFFFERLRAMKR